MLRYEELIRKLTDSQKTLLLTKQESLSASWLDNYGIPKLNICGFDSALRTPTGLSLPSAERAAYTWNKNIMRAMSTSVAASASKNESSMVITPNLSVPVGWHATGMSEDPVFNGDMGRAICDGIGDAGAIACVSNVSLTEENAAYLDYQPEDSVLQEILLRPYKLALRSNARSTLMTNPMKLSGPYENINSRNIRHYLRRNFYNTPVLCDKVSVSDTTESLAVGNLMCLNGSEDAVTVGLENHRKMSTGMQNGTIPFSELAKAEEIGTAVSADMLDNAADRILSFLFDSAEHYRQVAHNTGNITPDILRDMYVQSTVLLKNNGVLPLKQDAKVAVLGEIPANCDFMNNFSANCVSRGRRCVGYARGYNFDEETGSQQLTDEAMSLAQNADVVVVIVREHNDAQAISANRLALIEDIRENTPCQIVCVLLNDTIDINFDAACDALLLSSACDHESGVALGDILLGKCSPTGRLTKTIFRDRKYYYSNLLSRRKDQDRKIGRLFGYRYCQSTDLDMAYPFGFGLNYCKINYRGLAVDDQFLRVTVTNTGKIPSGEAVQVYIGKSDSACVLPQKTLVAFDKVSLEPGESKEVTFPISELMGKFDVYDIESGTTVTEDGTYQIYVGDLMEPRLQTQMRVQGTRLNTAEDRDIYEGDDSNIFDGGYRLQNTKEKLGFFKNAAVLFTMFAILFDVILAICLNQFSEIKAICIILITIISATAVSIDMLYGIRKAKNRKASKAEEAAMKLCQEQWDLEELQEELPLTQLFATTETAVEAETKKAASDATIFVNRGMKFTNVCENLMGYMSDKGIGLRKEDAQSVLAAVASTRLLIFRNADPVLLSAFINELSTFFSGQIFQSDVFAYEGTKDLLSQEHGICNCLDFADANRNKIVFQTLIHVDMQTINKYFVQLIRYFSNPTHGYKIEADINNTTVQRVLPPNLWFILVENTAKAEIPPYISEFAAVVDLSLRQAVKGDSNKWYEAPMCDEFLWTTNVKRGAMSVSETVWKKLDSLERFVKSNVNFTIENKKWGQVERFIAVYLACLEEPTDENLEQAVDTVLAAELLIGMATTLQDKLAGKKNTLLEIVEKTFGQDKVAKSTSMLKTFDAKGISH